MTQRKLVLPGDVVGDSRSRPGVGTKQVGDRLVALQAGLLEEVGDRVHVLAASGAYEPRPGDQVVGFVTEANTGNWMVDIRAPWPAPLHVSEAPWRVDFGETTNYLKVGDALLCKVLFVDEQKKLQVTLKDRNLMKLEGGEIVEVPAVSVARVIGKNGAMINLLKEYIECWMLVGQNGRVWLNGEPKEILMARKAIEAICDQAHMSGLTERIRAMLEAYRPGGVDAGIRIERAGARKASEESKDDSENETVADGEEE